MSKSRKNLKAARAGPLREFLSFRVLGLPSAVGMTEIWRDHLGQIRSGISFSAQHGAMNKDIFKEDRYRGKFPLKETPGRYISSAGPRPIVFSAAVGCQVMRDKEKNQGDYDGDAGHCECE